MTTKSSTFDAGSHYERGYHSTHQKPLFTNEAYFMARAELALGYFTPDERNRRVFDYGCGLGSSIALLPHAEGWDISSEAREACRRRGIRVYDDLDEVPRGAFGVVLCRHVLEHVEQPLAALDMMRDLLEPGGVLILVLPKEEHWIPTHRQPDVNQHLYCWTPRTAYNLLWRAGFEPRSAEYEYPFGARRLLPLRRYLGSRAYRAAYKLGGVLRRNGEMIIKAGNR